MQKAKANQEANNACNPSVAPWDSHTYHLFQQWLLLIQPALLLDPLHLPLLVWASVFKPRITMFRMWQRSSLHALLLLKRIHHATTKSPARVVRLMRTNMRCTGWHQRGSRYLPHQGINRVFGVTILSSCPTIRRHVGLLPFFFPPSSHRASVLVRSNLADAIPSCCLLSCTILIWCCDTISHVRYTSTSHSYDH